MLSGVFLDYTTILFLMPMTFENTVFLYFPKVCRNVTTVLPDCLPYSAAHTLSSYLTLKYQMRL